MCAPLQARASKWPIIQQLDRSLSGLLRCVQADPIIARVWTRGQSSLGKCQEPSHIPILAGAPFWVSGSTETDPNSAPPADAQRQHQKDRRADPLLYLKARSKAAAASVVPVRMLD